MKYLIVRSVLSAFLVVICVPIATVLFPIVLTSIIVNVVFNMPITRERKSANTY
jgi:hypothetical protein